MNLQEIRSIIELVNFKVSPLKNIFRGDDSGTKLYKLFKGIEDNKWSTDEEAAAEIYGRSPSDKRYMMLRINTAEELASHLPFFDYSRRFSVLASKTLEFQRTLSAITILLYAGMSTVAIRLTTRLLKEAAEYDVTSVRLNCLRILREDSLYTGNIEAMQEFIQQFNAVLALYNAELYAEALCQEVEAHFINSTAQKQEIADKAFQYEQYLRENSGSLTSSTLELYRYRILLHAFQISGKLAEAIQICTQAKEYLLSKPLLNSKTRQAEFSLNAMSCAILLREYEDALMYGMQCMALYTRGKRNWYLVVNSAFLCALHTGSYELAVDLYTRAVQESGFERLPPFEQHKWNLYQAYLSLFFSMGIIHSKDKKIAKMFQVGDALRIVLEAFKDKKGLNIPLQILHIVYYIHIKDFQQATAKIDTFHKYANSHLNQSEHQRTLIFLTMLKLLRKHQYNTLETKTLAEPHYRELLLNPQKQEQFVEANEIIPYDMIWQWLMEENPKKVTGKAV